MQAAECTFRELIIGQKQYVVPSFQRPYSWREERWATFLDGIIELFEKNSDQELFLGALVTMPIRSPRKEFNKYLLVDG